MSAPEYRIEFSIQRCVDRDVDEEFVEIGFGSSGAWDDLDACVHSLDSGITNGEWETSAGMPDRDEVIAALAERRRTI